VPQALRNAKTATVMVRSIHGEHVAHSKRKKNKTTNQFSDENRGKSRVHAGSIIGQGKERVLDHVARGRKGSVTLQEMFMGVGLGPDILST